MKCADCGKKALWTFDDPGALPVSYCDKCLPWMLRQRAIDGSLKMVKGNAPH